MVMFLTYYIYICVYVWVQMMMMMIKGGRSVVRVAQKKKRSLFVGNWFVTPWLAKLLFIIYHTSLRRRRRRRHRATLYSSFYFQSVHFIGAYIRVYIHEEWKPECNLSWHGLPYRRSSFCLPLSLCIFVNGKKKKSMNETAPLWSFFFFFFPPIIRNFLSEKKRLTRTPRTMTSRAQCHPLFFFFFCSLY